MQRPAFSPSAAEPSLRVERSGAERQDEHLLERVLTDPRTRILAVRRDAVPVAGGHLRLVGVEELLDAARALCRPDRSAHGGSDGVQGTMPHGISAEPSSGSAPAASDARSTTVRGVREWAFLGRDADGQAIVLAVLADDVADELVPRAVWAPLRAAGGDLPDGEGELLTTAVALAGWLRDAPFCSACGSPTQVRHAGWSRHCPACGREHFPRTDPAVIVLVTSAESDERILLGANAAWAGQRYSCFAGFAEAGESLEDAVAREVEEESGVRLREVAYRASQAWPYPRSLMLGFRAAAVDDGEARADGEEIVEVRWFSRDEVGAALRGETEVQLPGAASIARRLIDDWYRGVA